LTGLIANSAKWDLVPNCGWWISIYKNASLNLEKLILCFSDSDLGEYEIPMNGKSTPFLVNGAIFKPLIIEGEGEFGDFLLIRVLEEYKKGPLDIFPGDVILDIGASYGFFSIHANEIGAKRIIAVEPSPEVYACLVVNIENTENIEIINKAIGYIDGKETFLSYPGTSIANRLESIETFATMGLPADTSEVETININTLFEEKSIDIVDFMKINCEGGELNLFATITNSNIAKIQKIFVQYHTKVIGLFLTEKFKNCGLSIHDEKEIVDIGFIYAYR